MSAGLVAVVLGPPALFGVAIAVEDWGRRLRAWSQRRGAGVTR